MPSYSAPTHNSRALLHMEVHPMDKQHSLQFSVEDPVAEHCACLEARSQFTCSIKYKIDPSRLWRTEYFLALVNSNK